jgi:putative flippase GtrA
VVTFLGNRHWAFKHRKGAGLKRETLLFVLLNVVGYGIQVGIVDIAYYGLGYKDGLSYNIATVIGIGLATLFRLFAYRTFVFNNHQDAGDGGEAADELYPVSTK